MRAAFLFLPERTKLAEIIDSSDYSVDSNGCWIWKRRPDRDGYARATGGVMAHRLCYVQYRGPVKPGLTLDHLCRVRSCINPDHLEPCSMAENSRRGSRTKLNRDKVREIRRRSSEGESYRSIALYFDVAPLYRLRNSQVPALDRPPNASGWTIRYGGRIE